MDVDQESFCHLHTHSQYSILDATLSMPALVKKIKESGMKQVALTDHGNLFGAVDFYKACTQAKIKPIIGCEMNITLGSHQEKKRSSNAFHITLLAKNSAGYANLVKLSSLGFIEGFYYVPRIDIELLKIHSEGLICLSGCIKSPFAHAITTKNPDLLRSLIEEFKTLFKEDFYFELQRHPSTREDLELDGTLDESWLFQQYQEYLSKQKLIEQELLQASKIYQIPYVATQNCHYGEREEWKAHEVLLNIQSGEPRQIWQHNQATGKAYPVLNPKRATFPSHEFYLKTPQEMQALFQELPEAISETVRIANKCSLTLDFQSKHYPVFYPPEFRGQPLAPDIRTEKVNEFLRELSMEGIKKRYTEQKLQKIQEIYPDKNPLTVVQDRLDYELHIITTKGMTDYLLIVWDFINWAKCHGIPMGPGRGSGAGSIILYAIGITDIEPLRFNLFFERFINPERLSYPDIDVDICMDRRPEVIQYTINTYGKENVAQIITFGTMKAKMSIKDVGRVLNIPLSKVNYIAKLIPDDLNITIEKALEKDRDLLNLYETDDDAKSIISLAKTLEGSIRNTGIHAAGLIVSGKPLMEHVPVATAKDSDMFVTQYSMKPVEMVGMLKIDFLGLKTLTSIQIAIDAIYERLKIKIDWINLDLDDLKTFEILNQGKTLGIFQLESGGMQELAKQLHLDSFEEIIAVLSLYRPGPMDMIPSFIARKHGREPIEYDHPWLESILQETYGIMVYQEQVMQIASQLANYSLGEGDVLRRAMGKKDMKEMALQRSKFLEGAMKNGIEAITATAIFDKMEKFAEYGFNKSHAAAYGYLTYVTAFLKANYTGEWLSALMTCDKDDTGKISKFMHEAFSMHIPCLPPDINESGINFTFTGSGIRFALSAIKGVGAQVVESLIEERLKNGLYLSLSDCIQRSDTKKIGKKAIELLIEAGAFDRFSPYRDELISSVESLYDQKVQSQKEKERGIFSLFETSELLQEKEKKSRSGAEVAAHRRSKEELLFKEKAILGLFISGHPLHEYATVLQKVGTISIQESINSSENSVFRLSFVIESMTVKIASKSQKKFAIIKISDASSEVIEIPIWPEMFEKYQTILSENALLWGIFSKERRMGSETEIQIACRWLGSIKKIDLAQVQESEEAYDRAKSQIHRPRSPSNSQKRVEKKEIGEEATQNTKKKICILSLQLESLRASHILAIKKEIENNPGAIPLEIRFFRKEEEVVSLQIFQHHTIGEYTQFKTAIGNITSYISCKIQEE